MEKYSEEAPVLVAQTGPLNGQRWVLRDTLLVGREAKCDIQVADRQVSRLHARFNSTPQGVILEDLGSKNGTHRNGQSFKGTVLLQDGDVIQIALAQQFVFLSSDATLPLDFEKLGLQGSQPEFTPLTPHTNLLRLEKRSRRVWIGDEEVLPPLSASQFRLLEILYEQQGQVVSRQELISIVWKEEQALEVSEQALDALVRRLRERLASIDSTHAYIATVRGHGLRLDNPQVAASDY
jgi:pSer/pThr/pTyr-binding forkhead associated (FHA) protein